LVYSTIGSKQHTVEVCITFQGRSNCRTASGPTRQEAMQTAVQNACALIASGVSETIACERTPPDRVTWK
jgi:hypothetical protein